MTLAAGWRWCLAAGLVAFACSWGFGLLPGLQACGGAPSGAGPIIDFEFARTPAEVAALFGAEPCRSTFAGAQRTGLWLDALVFIPSYAAFLALAAWASGGRRRRFVIGLVIAAALADQVEGVLLFDVLGALPGTQPVLNALGWVVAAKFVLLALSTLTVGVLIGKTRRPLGLAVSAVMFVAGLRAVLGSDGPASTVTALTIAWTTLLFAAAVGAVWPRLLAPRPPAPARPSA